MANETLIAALEKATGDSAELMREVFYACHPEPAETWSEAWQAWFVRRSRFMAMLNAEAYESAALTLVPASLMNHFLLSISPMSLDMGGRNWKCQVGKHRASAPTPALAICIAALRARHGEGEGA